LGGGAIVRELPKGWAITELENIVDILDSQRIPLNADERETRISGKSSNELYPYYGATGKVGEIDSFIFDEPIILLGEDGVPFFDVFRDKAYQVKEKCWVNNHAHVIRTKSEISEQNYVTHFLNNFDYTGYVSGTTRLKLTQASMRLIPILLAPLNEQKRIADRLDLLLTRIDKTKAHLDRIPPLLKRFRQSVLAAATSGKLTEDWREAKGLDDDILSAGWCQKLIKEVGNVQLGRQRSPKYHSGKYMRPYLRVQNIFEDFVDLDDVMEMDFPPPDLEKYRLHYGDILLNEGQSPHLLGRPAMYRDELPEAYFTNTLIRFQAYDVVDNEFALLVFRSYMHCGKFQQEGTITTNIAHLGAGRFADMEFPVPPLEEQHEIVRRVETLFAKADRIEAQYQKARQEVDRLTPALLAKAFRGELVPQDPNDEPASILLERVKAEKEGKEKKEKGRSQAKVSSKSDSSNTRKNIRQ
jgi:type I restriction enzyme, S subunit